MGFNWEADMEKIGKRIDQAIEDGDIAKAEELTVELRQIEGLIEERDQKALEREMNEHNFGYVESEGEIVGEEEPEYTAEETNIIRLEFGG